MVQAEVRRTEEDQRRARAAELGKQGGYYLKTIEERRKVRKSVYFQYSKFQKGQNSLKKMMQIDDTRT